MPALNLSCFGVPLRLVDDADTHLFDVLHAWLAPEMQVVEAAEDAGVGDAPVLRLTRDSDGAAVLETGGGTLTPGDGPDALLHCVLHEIDRVVATGSRRWLFVRAAAVGWRGRAIVIPGGAGTGKSMLAAALVRRGASYCSDTWAVLDEEGRVHPYRRALLLRDRALQAAADGLRLVRASEPAEPLPVGLVMATTYQRGAAWQPEVRRGARVALPLIDHTVLAREEHARLLRMAAGVADDAVLLQGGRGEAEEAAAHLLDMLDAVSASRALQPGGSSGRFADVAAPVALRRLAATPPRPLPTARGLWMAPHQVVRDLLPEQDHRRLVDFALANADGFQASRVNSQHGRARVEGGYRSSRTYQGDAFEPVWALLEPRLRAMLPAVRRALGLPWFRLGDVERQLTAHSDGGFFAPHADNSSAETMLRKVSCVVYFQARPRAYTGGTLRLYDHWVTPTGTTPAGTYTEVEPLDNSVVFFRSEDFHEVTSVRCDSADVTARRYTVVAWFRAAGADLAAMLPAHPAADAATANGAVQQPAATSARAVT